MESFVQDNISLFDLGELHVNQCQKKFTKPNQNTLLLSIYLADLSKRKEGSPFVSFLLICAISLFLFFLLNLTAQWVLVNWLKHN